MKNIIFLLFLLTTLFGAYAQVNKTTPSVDDQHFYVEHIDGNPKKGLTNRYKPFRKIYDGLSDEQKIALEKKGLQDFKKDNALLAYPRLLTPKEKEILEKGVAQRGLAIHAFLQDYYSGENSFLKAEIIPKEVLDRIVLRHGESDWKKYIRPEHISFWYGPDIIRGPPDPKNPEAFNFRIVEDNTDFIGGIGDLKLARESLEKNIPEYKKLINSPKPTLYYDKIAEEYFKRAKKFGGIPVMALYPRQMAADNEDKRIKEIFEERGIKTVVIDRTTNNSRRIPRLETDQEGVWLIEKSGSKLKKTKVGHIVGNMNVQDLEPSFPANRRYQVISAAKDALEDKKVAKPRLKRTEKLKKLLTPGKDGVIKLAPLEKFMLEEWPVNYALHSKELGVPGLLNSVFSGKLELTNTPGLQFVNDKEFYMYVDKMIEHYLHQKAIIPNIQTESFAQYYKNGKVALRKGVFNDVFKNIDGRVIKGVDGRGGDAVWVGPKMDKNYIPELKIRITKDPSRYIFQHYTPLDIIDFHIGDVRLHTSINPDGKIIVSPVSWGRVIRKGGDGKVNLSAHGKEIAIFTNYPKNTPYCVKARIYITNAQKLLEELK